MRLHPDVPTPEEADATRVRRADTLDLTAGYQEVARARTEVAWWQRQQDRIQGAAMSDRAYSIAARHIATHDRLEVDPGPDRLVIVGTTGQPGRSSQSSSVGIRYDQIDQLVIDLLQAKQRHAENHDDTFTVLPCSSLAPHPPHFYPSGTLGASQHGRCPGIAEGG